MKKAFLLIAVVALGLSASAQKFNITYGGTTYSGGDTIVLDRMGSFSSVDDFEAIADLVAHNLTGSAIEFQVRMDELDGDGLQLGICVGQCVPSNISNVGTLPAHGEMEVPVHFVHVGFASTRGLYRVNVYDTEAEGDTLQLFCRVDLSHVLGLSPVQEASALVAYPNPSHGQVTIACQGEGTVVVRDTLGRLVARLSAQPSLQLSLPRGLYTYGLEGQPMKKLIVR